MCNRPNKNQCDLFRWSNCRTKHVLHLITTHKPTHTQRDIESMCTEIMVVGVIVSSFPQWNGKKHLHKCGFTWAKSDLNICSIFFPEMRLIWWDWAWLLLLLSSKSSFHQLTWMLSAKQFTRRNCTRTKIKITSNETQQFQHNKTGVYWYQFELYLGEWLKNMCKIFGQMYRLKNGIKPYLHYMERHLDFYHRKYHLNHQHQAVMKFYL